MRPQYIVDYFVDSKGGRHDFVICAVLKEYDLSGVYCLDLGYSICNPNDTFNVELGKTIALGRANKAKESSLFAFNKGSLNIKIICALLESEAAYLKRNPGYKIAGYK